MPTPIFDLPLYGDGDTAELDVLLNGQSTALEAALVRMQRQFPQPVEGEQERDALFPSPVQGNAVFRLDLGYEERYFGVYNATSNPGGLVSAGWYPPSKMFQVQRANAQTLNAGWNFINSAWGGPAVNHLGSFASGGLTIARPGWYDITFGVHLSNATNPGAVQITKNSGAPDTANTLASDLINASTTALRTTTRALLASGDVIRGLVYTLTSNSLQAQPYGAHLSLELVNG